MEAIDNISLIPVLEAAGIKSPSKFIGANTVTTTLEEIKDKHLIPVFVQDNEPLISQGEFIEAALYVAESVFRNEIITSPAVRVSHPIKGRISEAKFKPANQLMDNEKTIFYERMAFIIEIPSVQSTIGGNTLSLTIGGVKAYNLDNFYAKRGADQHFKLFIGFKNTVCTNLCVWSDGFVEDVRVRSITELIDELYNLFNSFRPEYQLRDMELLQEKSITEKQFALLIGRARMYQYLPSKIKKTIPVLKITDAQINAVAAGYYKDEYFGNADNGGIDLWRLYNLLTGANKSSYIDSFLDKGVNCTGFINQVAEALDNSGSFWFLN